MKQKDCVTGVLQCAVLLLILLSSAESACRHGGNWIEYQGSCYWWGRTENWFKSELICKSYGGSLAIIRSQSENDFLVRMTQCSHAFWIGLVNTDPSCKTQPRCYTWWDNTNVQYNTLHYSNETHRECVVSDGIGRWQNTYCEYKYDFICKSPAVLGTSDEEHSNNVQSKSNEFAELPPAAHVANGTNQHYNTRLALFGTQSTPIRCPAGWQQLDNNCYFHSTNKTNYFNAQMSCEAMGATVTSVLTPREHTLLNVALGCRMPTWIGLEKTRPCFKRPGVDHCWVWMDRSPLNYSAWASGQANVDKRDAECVILDGQWSMTNCYNEFGYMCKKNLAE